jgi:predicted nuclease of predicted toxin-antitoxin system
MKYLIDANLPPRLLDYAEVSVEYQAIKDVFGADAKDPDWLPEAGKRGMIVVSLDRKMAHYRVHRPVLEASNVTIVFLPKSAIQNKKAPEQKAWCGIHWTKIDAHVRSLQSACSVVVKANGLCMSEPWTPRNVLDTPTSDPYEQADD